MRRTGGPLGALRIDSEQATACGIWRQSVASPASNASRTAETTGSPASSAGTGSGSNTNTAVDSPASSTRDDFLLELGDALGGQASVRPVDSIAAALEYLS